MLSRRQMEFYLPLAGFLLAALWIIPEFVSDDETGVAAVTSQEKNVHAEPCGADSPNASQPATKR